ncbi:MAG TPA: MarR family winged helix-turn-helix transcriptional regulator [Solirubrobacteraceae bacterium]|jgi:DNA-binding MarR family transcriptional regulator|nr:MarR family winged helix-turn-helix transcriptional regulator [Solirubrobacteraceae bacterium]
MSPAPPRSKRNPAAPAAAALLASAPLVTRWTERLLAQVEPRITLSQYLALRAIADEPVSAAELAHRTGVSGPAVSQLLATLVTPGWVDRRAAASDRRRQELSLTADGQALLATVEGALIARLGELIEPAPPPELDALTRSLVSVRAALAGTPPPRRPRPPGPHGPAGPPPHRLR